MDDDTQEKPGQINVTGFPPDLKRRLQRAAIDAGVTMSALVVSILDRQLPEYPGGNQ